MIRAIISFIVAFAVTALVGRFLIPWLHALKAGQTIKEIGPKWHMNKQGTPTMGGIMFIVGIFVAILAAGWQDFKAGDFSALIVFAFALVFGIIGFIDDFCKVKFHKNEGLTAAQKFLLQLAAAIVFVVLLRYTGHISNDLYIPFFNATLLPALGGLYDLRGLRHCGLRQLRQPDRRHRRSGHRRHHARHACSSSPQRLVWSRFGVRCAERRRLAAGCAPS